MQKKLYAAVALFSGTFSEASCGDAAASGSPAEKDTPKKSTLSAPLSRRENEVLSYLSQGLTRGEIAAALNLSINTVKSNVRSIYNKLGAVNRSDAVRIAAANGILQENSPN
jgi:LuxR family maltose regulon positive regulatory protein